MRIGIFAKTFAGSDPDTVLAASRRAGYDAVQYNMACSGLGPLPARIDTADVEAVARAAAANRVDIAAISATYNMVDPDPVRRSRGRTAFAAIAAAAGDMGTRLVTVCSGSLDPQDQWRHHPDNDGPDAWRAMCREFEAILAIADAHDVLIGVEPEPANVVGSAASAQRLLRTFQGSRIRIVLDPANLLEAVPGDRRTAVLDAAFDRLGPLIALAHAKDRDDAGRVVPPGHGIVDWDRFIGGLRGVGFDGALVAHGFDAGDAPSVAAFLARHGEVR
jgi:sugar phosphate isomerase/epimerase